jgi:hypothetical protein
MECPDFHLPSFKVSSCSPARLFALGSASIALESSEGYGLRKRRSIKGRARRAARDPSLLHEFMRIRGRFFQRPRQTQSRLLTCGLRQIQRRGSAFAARDIARFISSDLFGNFGDRSAFRLQLEEEERNKRKSRNKRSLRLYGSVCSVISVCSVLLLLFFFRAIAKRPIA